MDFHSNHKPSFYKEYSLNEGFDFHPQLGDWLKKYLELEGNETIRINEVSCEEDNCPFNETIFIISNSKINFEFRVSQKKESIRKQDIYFSAQKQLNKTKDSSN